MYRKFYCKKRGQPWGEYDIHEDIYNEIIQDIEEEEVPENEYPHFPPRDKPPLEEGVKLVRDALQTCVSNHTGSFHAGGNLDLLVDPEIQVKGLGQISLPLDKKQANQLVQVCEQSPFGRGSETVVDTSVRNSWQLEPSKWKTTSRRWKTVMKNIIEDYGQEMGYDNRIVKAVPHKLLIYQKGGHFDSHRDTEKVDGMFGTLSVQLPSKFQGGKYTIEHGGESHTYDMAPYSEANIWFIAHYADCLHRIAPIRSGYRLVLVYSLCWDVALLHEPTPPRAPTFINDESIIMPIRDGFQAWMEEVGSRPLLLFKLYHYYSEDSLQKHGHKAMKGTDAELMSAIFKAIEICEKNRAVDLGRDLQLYFVNMVKTIAEYHEERRKGSVEGGYIQEKPQVFNMQGQQIETDMVPRVPQDVLNIQRDDEVLFYEFELRPQHLGYTGNDGCPQRYIYETWSLVLHATNKPTELNAQVYGLKRAIQMLGKKPSTLDYQALLKYDQFRFNECDEESDRMLADLALAVGNKGNGSKSKRSSQRMKKESSFAIKQEGVDVSLPNQKCNKGKNLYVKEVKGEEIELKTPKLEQEDFVIKDEVKEEEVQQEVEVELNQSLYSDIPSSSFVPYNVGAGNVGKFKGKGINKSKDQELSSRPRTRGSKQSKEQESSEGIDGESGQLLRSKRKRNQT